ncbi:MAG: 50S ribosomal protein L30 [Buchnera aphidicola (Schlechtendalia peitan)]
MVEYISIIQVKSSIGRLPKHKATLIGLGLRYIGHTVKRKNTPSIQGMVKKLSYMIKVI